MSYDRIGRELEANVKLPVPKDTFREASKPQDVTRLKIVDCESAALPFVRKENAAAYFETTTVTMQVSRGYDHERLMK